MTAYSETVQTTLTEEQVEFLSRLAQEKGTSISTLVREAVEQIYFEEPTLRQRREALGRLLELEVPVSDWEEMEAEIGDGVIESENQ